MNSWKRIDGPDKVSLCQFGDDARGDYAWSSLYGCGLARVEIGHVLVANDMMEEWGNDDDEDSSRVYVLEVSHMYTVHPLEEAGDYGEPDDSGYEDYQYEAPGLYDYELHEADRAYAALDEMASHDMSWALCGPDEKADEVYERAPLLRDWDAAMKSEELLDTGT